MQVPIWTGSHMEGEGIEALMAWMSRVIRRGSKDFNYSTFTPFQKATRPRTISASGFGSA